MNAWISSINAAAAGWSETLLRATWQGSIALILVWMISRWIAAIPGRSKAWLWRLAFLKLLVALLWVTPISLAILPAKRPAIASARSPLPTLPVPTEPVAASGSTFEVQPEVQPVPDGRAWLLATWIAGVLWGTARIARQRRAARALQKNSEEVRDALYQDMLRRLAVAFRLRRVPALCRSESITSPVLVGLIRPSIILPSRVLHRFDTSQIEMMLAHELAHLRRKDLWWLWLFSLCEALFFFHPLVWLVRRECNLATESACDELALRLTRRAEHEYGSMLVDVIAQAGAPRRSAPVFAAGMFETRKTLERRLKVMAINKSPLTTVAAILLIAVAAFALVPCRLVAQAPDAETLARLKEENAKLKQELDATRQEIEALRQSAIGTRHDAAEAKRAADRGRLNPMGQRGEMDSATRSFEQFKTRAETEKQLEFAEERLAELEKHFSEGHPEVVAQRRKVERLQQYLEKLTIGTVPAAPGTPDSMNRAEIEKQLDVAERNLIELEQKFPQGHPDLVAQRRKIATLRRSLNTQQPDRIPDPLGQSRNTQEAFVPARPGQRSATTEERALLLEEIKLAEQQAQSIRKMSENGKALTTDVLNVQRELGDLRLQLARLEGSKAEQRAALLQQLKAIEALLKEERKRVEVGTLPPGAEIPFEREVLRLKRILASIE